MVIPYYNIILYIMSKRGPKQMQTAVGIWTWEKFDTVLTSMAESQWRPVHDTATGRTCYFHSKTKETKWVKPDSKTSVDSFLQSEGLIANEDTI
jgi:hypothetical protein